MNARETTARSSIKTRNLWIDYPKCRTSTDKDQEAPHLGFWTIKEETVWGRPDILITTDYLLRAY